MIIKTMQRKISPLSLIILLVSMFFMSTINLPGQERLIKGRVVSFNSIPLNGVEVKAKKSKQTTVTDSLGNFEILVMTKKDKLKFRANGFKPLNYIIQSQNDLKLNMVFVGTRKNVEMVTAYGYISKDDLTYAMANLNSENNSFQNYHNIFDAIESFAGVTVNRSTYPPDVNIRGVISFYADNTPLFIVDGISVDISYVVDIHVSELAQISVIKDSAAAIYGSRGANGVILIELK